MCCASEVYSQDPQFTQFYANPLYLNPAFAGTGRCPRGVINYRNQWPNINGRYVTYSASGDFHSDKLAGGVGMIITNDDQALGKLKTTNVSLIYSYQAVISNKLALKFGLQGTYMQKNLDVNNLHFGIGLLATDTSGGVVSRTLIGLQDGVSNDTLTLDVGSNSNC